MIDPSIPLAVRPPEAPDMLGTLGKIMQLRTMQQQGAAQGQEQQLRDQSIQENSLKLASMQRVSAGRAALTSILQDPTSVDPETGQVKHEVVAQKLGQAGFDDMAESWLKQSASNAELLDKIHATAKAHAESVLEAIGGLAASAKSPQDFDAGLGLLATQHVIDGGTAQKIAAQADAAGPDGWRQLAAQYVKYAPSSRKAALEAQNKVLEPVKLGPGETYGVPGQPPLATGGSNSTKETKSVLVDGKPAEVVFDNKSGAYTQGGQQIDPSRVTPKPDAAVTIHNMNGQAANMPAWALDDSRPAGDQKNVMDPNIRMTPNGLYQAAVTNIATGQFPPTGRGSDPVAIAQRAAITSKVGAIAEAAGMDVPALRAFYKSNALSLSAQQKMYDAVQGFMATADKNAALLQTTMKKFPDVGSPLFNQPLRSFAKSVTGDPNMSQFATYLQSVQNEYGRIISQPNLAGQLTDSARHEAEQLIDPKATVGQIVASVQALTNEGSNRLVSVGEQIQRIQKRMSNVPGGQPADGNGFSVTDPNGKVHPFATQAEADAFKKLAGIK